MKKSILFSVGILTCMTSVSAIRMAPSFDDVDFENENFDAIEYVKNQNIVEGYENGGFKPLSKINRAEFTKIVMASQFSQKEIENCDIEGNSFEDVDENAWFAPYICLAKQKGIINGYDDGSFKPEKEIQFTEASKIISQTFGYSAQEGEIWYEPFTLELEKRGAIPTSINNLTDEITRGEMAEMIFRLKNSDIKKLSKKLKHLEHSEEFDEEKEKREFERKREEENNEFISPEKASKINYTDLIIQKPNKLSYNISRNGSEIDVAWNISGELKALMQKYPKAKMKIYLVNTDANIRIGQTLATGLRKNDVLKTNHKFEIEAKAKNGTKMPNGKYQLEFVLGTPIPMMSDRIIGSAKSKPFQLNFDY